MTLYVAIADYDGDATAEVPELSFREGERIVILDDDTYVAGCSVTYRSSRRRLLPLFQRRTCKSMKVRSCQPRATGPRSTSRHRICGVS